MRLAVGELEAGAVDLVPRDRERLLELGFLPRQLVILRLELGTARPDGGVPGRERGEATTRLDLGGVGRKAAKRHELRLLALDLNAKRVDPSEAVAAAGFRLVSVESTEPTLASSCPSAARSSSAASSAPAAASRSASTFAISARSSSAVGSVACQAEWQLIAATHNLLKLWRAGLTQTATAIPQPLAG